MEASGDRSTVGRHACYRHNRCMVLAVNSRQRRVVPAVGSQNHKTQRKEKGGEIPDATGRHSIGGHLGAKGVLWTSSGLLVD